MKQLTLTINDQQVAYWRQGKGQSVLFLHGGRVRARTFRKLLVNLAKEYEVIAPDIPGYGSSPTPKKVWSFVDYADFFDDFLAKLNLTNVIVIGYSMGGGVALNMAARSKRVSRLVLIDTSGLTLPEVKMSHHDLSRLWFYLSHPRYLPALYVLVRDYATFLWSHARDFECIQRTRARCQDTSYDETLQDIAVPTDIIWGRQDWIYPLVVADEFQRRIPHAILHIVPGNHDWPVYSPERVVGTVLLQTIVRGRRSTTIKKRNIWI